MAVYRRPHGIAFAANRVVGVMRGIEQRNLPVGMLRLRDDMPQRNSRQAKCPGVLGFIHQQRRVWRQLNQNAGQPLLLIVAISRVGLGLAQSDGRFGPSQDVAGRDDNNQRTCDAAVRIELGFCSLS